MNSYKSIAFFLTILFFSVGCNSQKMKNTLPEFFSGQISMGGDHRTLEIEIIRNKTQINWSIDKSGKHSIPLKDLEFDDKTNSFNGSLTFMGNEKYGELRGKTKSNTLNGKLIWHRDTLDFSLNKVVKDIPYEKEKITITTHDQFKLDGTLLLPKSANKIFPLIIFTHGSGYSEKYWGMYWAREFSKIGVASFLYDKRGCGKSEGNWMKASLSDLSKDVVSAIEAFKNHNKIDAEKIGVYGVSQAGWVISKANSLTNNISFNMINSGGGISPYEEELFSYDINLQFAGVKENDRREAISLVKNYLEYLRTGEKREQLIEMMNNAKGEYWYKFLGLERVMVSEVNRKNWEWVATYQPENDIIKIKKPVLLLFGGEDHVQPTNIAIEKWEAALKKGGNTQYQIKVYLNAGHGLIMGGHHAKGFPRYANGHLELMKSWLSENVL